MILRNIKILRLFLLTLSLFACTTTNTRTDSKQRTPLMIAIVAGEYDKAFSLIQKGVDVNARDKFGVTPLHFAAEKNNERLIKELLNAGANVNAKTNRDIGYFPGWTPLMTASNLENPNIVSILLNAGADVNITSEDGKTALFLAARNQHSKSNPKAVILKLLDAGANPDCVVYERGSKGGAIKMTPLIATLIWAKEKDRDIVQKILTAEKKFNVNRDLDFAIINAVGHNAGVGIVSDLIKAGASVNPRPQSTQSLLGFAEQTGDEAVIRLLKSKGAKKKASEMQASSWAEMWN